MIIHMKRKKRSDPSLFTEGEREEGTGEVCRGRSWEGRGGKQGRWGIRWGGRVMDDYNGGDGEKGGECERKKRQRKDIGGRTGKRRKEKRREIETEFASKELEERKRVRIKGEI